MISDLRKLWGIFTASERRRSVFMVLVVVVMALLDTVSVLSIMPFLSVLAGPEAIASSTLLQGVQSALGFKGYGDLVLFLGMVSICFVVLASVFKAAALHALNRFTYFLRHEISSRLLSSYLAQPYSFFLRHNSSELSRNVISEVDLMHVHLIKPVSQLMAQGAVVAAMALLLLFYDPVIAVSSVAVVGGLYAAVYRVVRRRLAFTGVERQRENGARFQAGVEAIAGIKAVKISGSADAYQVRFDRASRECSRHQANAETLSQSPLYMVEAVGYSGLIVFALFLLMQSGDVAKVLPALGMYGFAAYRMLPSVQIMYRGIAQLKISSSSLDTIHRDLSLPKAYVGSKGVMIVPRTEIALRDIWFSYESDGRNPVLSGFGLVIPVGLCVGIVGKSGAGKSTVLDLLLGLLKPQRGGVYIDGVLLEDNSAPSWLCSVGYVPQNVFLADLSVLRNIAFGVPDEEVCFEKVEKAARAAQIHDFIVQELPYGYDTEVGERGVRLSGGQIQRLGIARALYRDPPVLVFDEATSALDVETERELTDTVKLLSGRKTIVVVAHREESLRACDCVVSLSADLA